DDAVVTAERGERAGDRHRTTGSWHRDELGARGDDRVERRLPAVLAATDRGAEGVVVADPDVARSRGVGREREPAEPRVDSDCRGGQVRPGPGDGRVIVEIAHENL